MFFALFLLGDPQCISPALQPSARPCCWAPLRCKPAPVGSVAAGISARGSPTTGSTHIVYAAAASDCLWMSGAPTSTGTIPLHAARGASQTDEEPVTASCALHSAVARTYAWTGTHWSALGANRGHFARRGHCSSGQEDSSQHR